MTDTPDPSVADRIREALDGEFDVTQVLVDHAECSADDFCPTCQDNWTGSGGARRVYLSAPTHGTVPWPCLPFLVARHAQRSEELLAEAAAALDEKDAEIARLRTGNKSLNGPPGAHVVDTLPDRNPA